MAPAVSEWRRRQRGKELFHFLVPHAGPYGRIHGQVVTVATIDNGRSPVVVGTNLDVLVHDLDVQASSLPESMVSSCNA